jgi:hypothetical protein
MQEMDQKQETPQTIDLQGFKVVAGAGFEPATFRL